MFKTTQYLFTVATMLSVAEGVGFGIVICLLCGLYPGGRRQTLTRSMRSGTSKGKQQNFF